MKKSSWIIIILFCSAIQSWSTHIRAGEITLQRIDNITYRITLTVYGNRFSAEKNDFATINFGDGTSQSVFYNNSEVNLSPDTYKRTYVVTKAYAGIGTFRVSYNEVNRNSNILNMSISVDTPFYVESFVSISPFIGVNNPVQLTIPPIDVAAVGELFVHNAGAYDIDGDSLSFKLVTPSMSAGVPVNGYFNPPASASFSLNPVTGDLIWNAPITAGLYNVAFIIEEWRKGADGTYSRVSFVTRDMQINVLDATNNPPVVTIPQDTCIQAGTLLSAVITAADPDGHPIDLTATPAGYFSVVNPQNTPASGSFSWQTSCAHVREQPYFFVFRAEDIIGNIPLTDYKTWTVKVKGPAPTGLTVVPVGNSIALSWNAYPCLNAEKIEIYRIACDSINHTQRSCETGLEGFPGYVKVGEVPIVTTGFLDNNNGLGLVKGIKYCYLLVAQFPLPLGGTSYASLQNCASLVVDVPLLFNVSVSSTGVSGSMLVDWYDPITTSVPAPYSYNVYRADGIAGTAYSLIASNVTPPFIDTGINTLDNSYSYRIELIGGGTSDVASSIAFTTKPSNSALTLDWDSNVPWQEDSVTIYRSVNGNSYSVLVTLPGNPKTYFDDQGLENCDTVCYRLRIYNAYCDDQLPQVVHANDAPNLCDSPIDTRMPQPPTLTVTGCEGDIANFTNLLDWNDVSDPVCNTIDHYNIYYSDYEDSQEQLIATTPYSDTDYIYTNLMSTAGCFSVSAVNRAGVEGEKSAKVCVDDCVFYELPNLVTPNGDSLNDYFRPFPVPRGVQVVSVKIFNRWGGLVFSSDDNIHINWDSRSNEGESVTDGVYYYSALVKYYRRKDKADELQVMKGWIQVIENHNGSGKE